MSSERPQPMNQHRSVQPAMTRSAFLSLAAFAALFAHLAGGCASTPSDPAPAPAERGLVAETAPPMSKVLAEQISIRVASRSEFARWNDDLADTEPETVPQDPAAGDQSIYMVVTREIESPTTESELGLAPGQSADVLSRAWIVRRFLVDPTAPESADAGNGNGDGGAGGKLIREMRIVRTEAGGLAISEEINYVERVRVEFIPPMYILPAELPIEGEQCIYDNIRMVVRDLGRPDRIKAEGKVRHVVCYEADETIRTPAGRLRAHRIMSRFDADMGASKVQNLSYQWFVPEFGLVAERRHETTTALGLKIRDNRDGWIVRSLGR